MLRFHMASLAYQSLPITTPSRPRGHQLGRAHAAVDGSTLYQGFDSLLLVIRRNVRRGRSSSKEVPWLQETHTRLAVGPL
jgi:hypothetical protein